MVSKAIVRLSNSLTRLRSPRFAPCDVVILIPSCLQNSDCTRKVTLDTANCGRCGKCAVGALVALGGEFGVRVVCATGGRLALETVKDKRVKGIVAVACEKELRAGILGSFPKPVMAIVNMRPHGPCRDTQVDVTEVRRAVESFLSAEPGATRRRK